MIKTLVKIRLAAFVAAMTNPRRKKGQVNTGKPRRGMLVLFIFLYLYLGGVFLGLFFGLFSGMMGLFADGNGWGYFLMFAGVSFLLMAIGSIFMAKAQIFEAKDNDLLLSMPIKPRDILLSRILPILFFNYLYEAVAAIPASVLWAFAGNGTFTALRILIFLVIAVLLPVFSLAFSGLFAWLISAISTRIKRKNLMTVALSLTAIGAYFYFYFGFMNNAEEIYAALGSFALSLKQIAPLYWMGKAIADGDLLCFAYSLAFLVIPSVLVYRVLSHSFIRLVTAKNGTSGLKKKTDYKAIRAVSPDRALLRREFSRFFGSATYMLNDGLGIPMMIGAVAVYLLNKDRVIAALTESGVGALGADAGDLLGGIMCAMLVFLSSVCMLTAPSISLEGKTLWILRSMPVDGKQILRAKLNLQNVMLVPSVLICAILSIVLLGTSLPISLMLLLLPALFAVWGSNIGLICGLHHPMLDWQNETIPCKQGTAILLSMLFSTLPALVLIGVCAVGFFFSPWISLIGGTVLLTVGDVLSYCYLMKRGAVIWDEL